VDEHEILKYDECGWTVTFRLLFTVVSEKEKKGSAAKLYQSECSAGRINSARLEE
jgi:hypothetical protein